MFPEENVSRAYDFIRRRLPLFLAEEKKLKKKCARDGSDMSIFYSHLVFSGFSLIPSPPISPTISLVPSPPSPHSRPTVPQTPSNTRGTVGPSRIPTVDKDVLRRLRNISRQLERANARCSRTKLKLVTRAAEVESSLKAKLKRSQGMTRRRGVRVSLLETQLATAREELGSLRADFNFVSNDLEVAREVIATLRAGKVKTFDGRSYFPEVVDCVLGLQECNVADEKVPLAMRTVARLCGVELERVPSPASCASFAMAGLAIARRHAAFVLDDVISKGESACLVSDETTKLGSKLQLFGAGLLKADGNKEVFLFGLAEVPDKSAKTAFHVLKERLDRIGRIGDKGINFFEKFLPSVSCAMSDRAATQGKFNQIISNYRSTLRPELVEGWEDLSDEERESRKVVHEFSCQLHIIANYTNVVLAALAEHESSLTGKDVPPLSPSVFVAVKEVARLFGDRASSLHSCSREYRHWSQSGASCESSYFPDFLGHRFNIVFVLGTRIFARRLDLVKFVQECGRGRPELLELSGLLSTPFIAEHLQILGLLDQFITGPLWRLAETSRHVLDTRVYASLLVEWVRDLRDRPWALFEGNSALLSLESISPSNSEFLSGLLSVPPSESTLKGVSSVMLSSIDYFEHLFGDFLVGGKFGGNMDSEVWKSTQCAPSTNRAIESGFGFVDRLFHHAPNMSLSRKEGKTMLTKNHTRAWLDSLPAGEKNRVIRESRASVGTLREQSKTDSELLNSAILSRMHHLEKEAAQKAAGAVQRRTKAAGKVSEFGFWTTPHEMDSMLNSFSDSEKSRALVVQLRFRQHVVKQKAAERGIFKLSARGKQFEWEELRRRLLLLLAVDSGGAYSLTTFLYLFITFFHQSNSKQA